jgi:thiosulfate/3-mercaptopyruvate sulfurtransferase
MNYQTLIDAQTLAGLIADPNLRVIDCRFDLGNPAYGRECFTKGHLPHGVYALLEEDLSGPRLPWSGRHPLPDPLTLAATFGRLGIETNTQVIAYDDSNGMYAARLWWLLRWLGHTQVAVLDGGLAAWLAAGGQLVTEQSQPKPTQFITQPARNRPVTADDVAMGLEDQHVLVLDARSAERFAGQVEPLDPRPGHIPGATNHFYGNNLDLSGRFLPAEALRARFGQVLGSFEPEEVISMCGSGVTACHNLLALEIAGLTGARLYPGSYSEWCRDSARPVALGPL